MRAHSRVGTVRPLQLSRMQLKVLMMLLLLLLLLNIGHSWMVQVSW